MKFFQIYNLNQSIITKDFFIAKDYTKFVEINFKISLEFSENYFVKNLSNKNNFFILLSKDRLFTKICLYENKEYFKNFIEIFFVKSFSIELGDYLYLDETMSFVNEKKYLSFYCKCKKVN